MNSGIGDWCSCGKEVPAPYVTTAFYVRCLDLIDDPKAERARQAILKKYYLGNGRFTVESSVMPALALEHRLVPASERMACEKELARIVSQNKGRVDFGTIGSGCVLRALFEAGMADLGYLMMTQPEPLGYAAIVGVYGATTFAEDWMVPESSSRMPCRTSPRNIGAFLSHGGVPATTSSSRWLFRSQPRMRTISHLTVGSLDFPPGHIVSVIGSRICALCLERLL